MADLEPFSRPYLSSLPMFERFGKFLKRSGPKWHQEVKTDDEFLENPSSSDLVIVVMGATGSGKSTFVNLLFEEEVAPVGHDLASETQLVRAYHLPDSEFPQNRIIIVDTPGFDDSERGELEIVRKISVWLAQSYDAKMQLAGVVYCHDITQRKWQGSTGRNFEVFEKLCGPAAAKKVVLLTTMWDDAANQATLENRVEKLKTSFWKGMLDNKCVVQRGILTKEAAQDTIDLFLSQKAHYEPLQIQTDLVTNNKSLKDTEAGRHLSKLLQKSLDTREDHVAELRKEAGTAKEVQITEAEMRHIAEQLRHLNIPITRRLRLFLGY
ncbi:hypothetical protein H0H92_005934 [Tricholoma furcatifolium]|nr:hypothetical protein H0H92_005934 [Tricholoma furcatifolium]